VYALLSSTVHITVTPKILLHVVTLMILQYDRFSQIFDEIN
jgi:hypothetical protein